MKEDIFKKRTQAIMRKAVGYAEDCDDPVDDSDLDPTWSPLSNEGKCDSPPSSPLTQEQQEVAEMAEYELNSAPPMVEENYKEKEDENHKSTIREDKIKNTREQILIWKTKIQELKSTRKEATKSGRRSSVKRMGKSIKKYEKFLADNDVSEIEKNCYSPENDINNYDDNNHPGNVTLKRKRNYCLYCRKLVAKFSEHLERIHKNEAEGILLLKVKSSNKKQRKNEKTIITNKIRKQWNSIYNAKVLAEDKSNYNKLIAVKKQTNTNLLECRFCKGAYRRDKLAVHIKSCTEFTHQDSSNLQAIKKYSSSIIANTSKFTDEFKEEILDGINLSDINKTAINDDLIMEFGANFHKSRREPSSKAYVLREVRDLTKLMVIMQKENPDIKNFQTCLDPRYFNSLIAAAQQMAGYNSKTGEVQVPSIAYRLTQPLNQIAALQKDKLVTDMHLSGSCDRSDIQKIDDFLELLKNNWKVHIGRICTKAQKKDRVLKNEKMALAEDITKMAAYIEGSYRNLISELKKSQKKNKTYDLLMHSVVTHIMLLIRRRPVDFKNANLGHYKNIDKHDELIDMAKGHMNMGEEDDFSICKKFHIFYVPGKNLEIVPMVLTPLMKQVVDLLLEFRSSVGINNDILFTHSGGKLIKPDESIKLMKRKVQLKKPADFTNNGLRHQAATFSRLHSNHPQYQDYLASALGHTLSVHKKHYELPVGILQKIMVCPILHKIMTGNNPDQEANKDLPDHLTLHEDSVATKRTSSDDLVSEGGRNKKRRWTDDEQEIVLAHFGNKVLKKEIPKRSEIVNFFKSKGHLLNDRSVAQVTLFVRNHANRQQLSVSPKVKKILSKR